MIPPTPPSFSCVQFLLIPAHKKKGQKSDLVKDAGGLKGGGSRLLGRGLGVLKADFFSSQRDVRKRLPLPPSLRVNGGPRRGPLM